MATSIYLFSFWMHSFRLEIGIVFVPFAVQANVQCYAAIYNILRKSIFIILQWNQHRKWTIKDIVLVLFHAASLLYLLNQSKHSVCVCAYWKFVSFFKASEATAVIIYLVSFGIWYLVFENKQTRRLYRSIWDRQHCIDYNVNRDINYLQRDIAHSPAFDWP